MTESSDRVTTNAREGSPTAAPSGGGGFLGSLFGGGGGGGGGAWAGAIGAGLGAYGQYQQAQAQNDYLNAAAQPRPFSQTTTPWGPALPYLEGALGQLHSVYNQTAGTPLPGPPHFSSGPRLDQLPSYGPLTDIAGQIRGQAANQDFVRGGQGFASSLMSGAAGNPYLSAAAASAPTSGSNPFLNAFMGQGFSGGFNPSEPYLQDWLAGRMSTPAGGAGSSGSLGYQIGGGGGASYNAPDYVAPEYDAPENTPTDYSNALFDDELSRIMQGTYLKDSNPYAAQLIDTMTNEALEAHQRGTADLDRRAIAGGRFGSSAHQMRQALAQEEYDEALQGTIANMRGSIYESERDRMMQGLGLVNQRDLAQWGDLTNRYGIDVGSATSRYGTDVGSATSRYGTDVNAATSRYNTDQNVGVQRAALGQAQAEADALNRWRNDQLTLQGINALTGNQLGAMGTLGGAIGQDVGLQQFGSGLLGDLGGAYLGAQTSAMGSVPSLEGAGYIGPGAAYDAFGNLLGMEQQDARARADAANQSALAAYQHQLAAANRPMDLIGRYLGGLGGLASLGGTTSGTQPGQVVGPQANTGLAALQGGLGGFATALNFWNTYNQGGNAGGTGGPQAAVPPGIYYGSGGVTRY